MGNWWIMILMMGIVGLIFPLWGMEPPAALSPLVGDVNLFYQIFIPIVIGGIGIFILSDAIRRAIEHGKRGKNTSTGNVSPSPAKSPRKIRRFRPSQRITHALLLLFFTMLGITGMSQKFAAESWLQSFIISMGGMESMLQVHRICAILLILVIIYHLLESGYQIFVHRLRPGMVPSSKDIKDALQHLRYNLGLARKKPQMGRYTFEEKAQYWMLAWSLALLCLSGLVIWESSASTNFLSIARAIHSGEAFLAILFVLTWHVYSVLVKKFNPSIWTGMISEEDLLREHPLELADLKSGAGRGRAEPRNFRERKIIYFSIASILVMAIMLGLYGVLFPA